MSNRSSFFSRMLSASTCYLALCGLLALSAFWFTWATGHRGIFFFDQSMIFDGGWRILQGQTPYKDFFMTFTPLTFYVQALFFKICGVNWLATALPACLIDALATLSVIRIGRLLGLSRVLALCAGLATAISLQPPFGTLFMEQTTMFFAILALQAAVESLQVSSVPQVIWQLAAGVLLAMSMLSKQNYGTLFVPIVFTAVVLGSLPGPRRAFRAALVVGIGIAGTLSLFLAWVWRFSDFSSFVRCAIVTAGAIGRSRLSLNTILQAFSFNLSPNMVQFDLIGAVGGGIVLCLALLNFRVQAWRELAPSSAVAMLLAWYRTFTQAVTSNEWQNNFAFVGLAGCLGLSLLFRLVDYITVALHGGRGSKLRFPSPRACKIGLAAACCVWGLLAFAYEARSAWLRYVNQFTAGATFRTPVHVRGLERVQWGEPTWIDLNATTALQRTDVEKLASYLAAKKKQFFIMGDATMFYGLLGVRSPQPLLYFQRSHSFLQRDIPYLDARISASLESNGVEVVVREKMTFPGGLIPNYSEFPRTWTWFTSNFQKVLEFGNFEIWERIPGALLTPSTPLGQRATGSK